jgi:polyvinyl alcohol dehydrogenase (cytochrome)
VDVPDTCGSPGSLAPSIVKLRGSDLTILSSWTTPSSSQQAGDPDFGGTPTLFTATIGGQVKQLVGAVNKDAIFYAWDRSNISAGPIWQTTVGTASGDPAKGSIISASFDGTKLYVGGGVTTVNGVSCQGNVDALNPATGAFLWRHCISSNILDAITVVPGVVVEGTQGNAVLFLNAATGATLFSYGTSSEVNGESTVSNGVVYIPVANGSLVALGQ